MQLQCLCRIEIILSLVAYRDLIEEGVDAVQPFRGKRLMGALFGEMVTTNSANRREMEALCKQHEVEIWLPDGDAFDKGDGCIFSPVAPSCSALAHPATPSPSTSLRLPRQQRQRRPVMISRFLSHRPIWLACTRSPIPSFVGYR